jgi:hypothetical protein
MPSRKTLASSVASTWKSCSSPRSRIAWMPVGMEPCRNPVVFEKTRVRKRASGSSSARTVTVTVFDASSSPSETVTFAL